MKAVRAAETPNVKSLGDSMHQARSEKHAGPKVASLPATMRQGKPYAAKKAPNYVGATMKQSGSKKK